MEVPLKGFGIEFRVKGFRVSGFWGLGFRILVAGFSVEGSGGGYLKFASRALLLEV